MRPLLELTDATVVKGGVRILDGLTLTIHEGEHTAILGPNGAGKTTLINLLMHQDRAFAHDDAPPRARVGPSWNVFELRRSSGSSRIFKNLSRAQRGRIRGLMQGRYGFFETQGLLIKLDARDHGTTGGAARAVDATALGASGWTDVDREARRVLIDRGSSANPRALVLDERQRTGPVARHVMGTVRGLEASGTTIVIISIRFRRGPSPRSIECLVEGWTCVSRMERRTR